MKKLLFITALLPAMVALSMSCSEKENPAQRAGKDDNDTPESTFTGLIGGCFTRTIFTEDGILLKGSWTAGDLISVSGPGATETMSALTSGAESDFRISGSDTEPLGPYTAFYPASVGGKSLPDMQQWAADTPAEVPMAASSDNRYLLFNPICGLVEVRLKTDLPDVVVSTLEISADQPLSGAFTLDDERKAVLDAGASKSLTLDCGNGVALGTSPLTFWFSVPAGSYSGFRISLCCNDGRTQEFFMKKGSSIDVFCGEITSCPIELEGLVSDEVTGAAVLPSGQEFNITLKSLANPGTPAGDWEPTTPDNSIKHIVFDTGSPEASGIRLGLSEVPVYASISDGTVTISTAAPTLKTSPDCLNMFRYMTGLESIDFGNIDTEGMADMSYFFNHCESLRTVNLDIFNTASVVTLDNCFSDCHSLEAVDLGSFVTSEVRSMSNMFNNCQSLKKIDLSGFDTKKCTALTYMFYNCRSLETIDMSGFDLGNVPVSGLAYHLFGTPSLKYVKTGPSIIPVNAGLPSYYCAASDQAAAERMGNASGSITFSTTPEVAAWLVRTNLRWVHSGYKNCAPVDINFIDQSTGEPISVTWAPNVLNSGGMAALPAGEDFNIALKKLANPDKTEVSWTTETPDEAIRKIVFITGDSAASGTRLGNSDIPVYAGYDSDDGTVTISTSGSEIKLNANSSGLFRYMTALESIDFGEINTVSVTDLSYSFQHCHALKAIDFSKFDTPALTNLDNMFRSCYVLDNIDMSTFTTDKVTSMRSMFNNCKAVRKLDLRNFVTTSCTIMTYMFYMCLSLEELDISGFSLTHMTYTNLQYQYYGTPSLRVVRTGPAIMPKNNSLPSYLFAANNLKDEQRTGYFAGGVTFYTTPAVAAWLARTNLRWINSGYNGFTPIPVKFIDDTTGEEISVTWAND